MSRGVVHALARERCGLCTRLFSSDECLTVLHPSERGTTFDHLTVIRPDSDQHLSTPENESCRVRGCARCRNHYSIAILHSDCLRLALQELRQGRNLDKICQSIFWREPWILAPQLDLRDESLTLPGKPQLDALNLGPLFTLPPEISQMIYLYSWESPLWRFSEVCSEAAARATDEISHLPPIDGAELQNEGRVGQWRIPLKLVKSWDRHRSSQEAFTAGLSSALTRVTIDSHGLVAIDACTSSSDEAIAVEDKDDNRLRFAFLLDDNLRDCSVLMMNGHARLQFDATVDLPIVWDTPRPPDWKEFLPRPPSYFRTAFRTVRAEAIRGITFFTRTSTMDIVHVHTDSSPTALETYNSLSSSLQLRLTWIYVPFPEEDPITNFGTRSYNGRILGYRLKSRLAETVDVGVYLETFKMVVSVNTARLKAFIYTTEPRYDQTAIYAITQNSSNQSPPNTFTAPQSPYSSPLPLAYFSIASLHNLATVQIFSDNRVPLQACDEEGCRGPVPPTMGLLLTYNNGSQRALGQCRFGLDDFVTVQWPTRLCMKSSHEIYGSQGVEAEAGSELDGEHDHGEEHGWCCNALEGSLILWYQRRQARFQFVANDTLQYDPPELLD